MEIWRSDISRNAGEAQGWVLPIEDRNGVSSCMWDWTAVYGSLHRYVCVLYIHGFEIFCADFYRLWTAGVRGKMFPGIAVIFTRTKSSDYAVLFSALDVHLIFRIASGGSVTREAIDLYGSRFMTVCSPSYDDTHAHQRIYWYKKKKKNLSKNNNKIYYSNIKFI